MLDFIEVVAVPALLLGSLECLFLQQHVSRAFANVGKC